MRSRHLIILMDHYWTQESIGYNLGVRNALRKSIHSHWMCNTSMKYYIWTVGCQMNVADSERLARELSDRGHESINNAAEADLVVMNTCSVRQAAEEKAFGRAGSIKPLKEIRSDLIVAFGGCMVADDTVPELRRRMPYVDHFFKPAAFGDLLTTIDAQEAGAGNGDHFGDGCLTGGTAGHEIVAGDEARVARWVPVMTGCNRRCTYCIVPFRRGREVSRPVREIVSETERLVAFEGAREVTLLGQIVDRYGRDLLPDRPDLGFLMARLSEIEGLERIRFLTSHPRDFRESIIDATANIDKVCEHINIPVQAGDDDVLHRMRRGYTVDVYRGIIQRIRNKVPGCSLATDIIVGFPGESEQEFQHTLDLLDEIKFDVVHVAMYSPRPGTRAFTEMPDDVPAAEKKARLHRVEIVQRDIADRINARLLDNTTEVLVEELYKGKWKGRTRTNKLVFFEDRRNWLGRLADVRITKTSPWSLQAEVVGGEQPAAPRPHPISLPMAAVG